MGERGFKKTKENYWMTEKKLLMFCGCFFFFYYAAVDANDYYLKIIKINNKLVFIKVFLSRGTWRINMSYKITQADATNNNRRKNLNEEEFQVLWSMKNAKMNNVMATVKLIKGDSYVQVTKQ